MVLKNLKIVLANKVIDNGYLKFKDGLISKIGEGSYSGEATDCGGLIAMPGFIDIHIHGSAGIDFMDAKEKDYQTIADSLFKEGVTTFLATTLTSDQASLVKVCKTVNKVKITATIEKMSNNLFNDLRNLNFILLAIRAF